MARFLLLALLMTASFVVNAEIYKWKDKDGLIHFSDSATEKEKYEKITVKVNTYTHVTYQKIRSKADSVESNRKSVVMYGTSWCGYCKKARNYFNSKNIDFTDLDVETNANAKAQFNALGGGGVPVILVGNMRINGFDEATFEEFYKKR